MSQIRPEVPGIERDAGWVPTDDPVRNAALDPGSIFNAGRQWTAFSLLTLGHTMSVNPATGGLVISATDLSMPYQSTSLRLTRTLDTQEQHAQDEYLRSHPNTDPRPHFFGNWQHDREVHISSTWLHSYPEVSVDDGQGNGSLFYRAAGGFEAKTQNAYDVEELLRSYGVPARTLTALGWQYTIHDLLLRSQRGPFGVLTGRYQPESMVDLADIGLYRFDPASGAAWKYTSEYSYNQLISPDGMREVSVGALLSHAVDKLGHTVTFQPVEAQPPYRKYELTDGVGRTIRLELGDVITYLDGNRPGARAKSYLVSKVIDETRPDHNVIEYEYDNGRLRTVRYPGQSGAAPREFTYEYDDQGHLRRITDPVGSFVQIDYLEDLLDADERLLPRLKVARITDAEGNSATYTYDYPGRTTTVTFHSGDGAERSVTYVYEIDANDTQERYITVEMIDVFSGYSGKQAIRNNWIYSRDGHFTLRAAIDPLGNAIHLEYNDFNQPTALINPTGHRQEFHYDVQAAPTPAVPNRYDLLRVSETNVDIDGVAFPVERKLEFERYGASTSVDAGDAAQSTHRIKARTDERGYRWTYEYDDAANHLPLRPTKMTDPLGKVSQWTYDGTGALLTETDADRNTWSHSYNDQGQLKSVTDPNRSVWSWVYDSGTGWVTDATDALGAMPGDPAHSVHFTWNDAGQRTRENDAVGDVTEYRYFANQRLRSVTGFDSARREVKFAYDATGNLTHLTDPRGHTTVFRYDEAGRLFETFRDAPTNPSIRFVLDLAGRVSTTVDRNGQQTQLSRDALGRVTRVEEPAWPAATPVNPGKTVTMLYDNLGHRLRVTDSQLPGNYEYRYDAAGNIRERTDPFGSLLTYTHDERNDLIRIEDDAGIVDLQFGRDDAGKLRSVTDSDHLDPARTFEYIRTDAGRVDNLYRIVADASGLETTLHYTPNRQLASVQHGHSGATIATYGYTYRADGLIGAATGTHTGGYDYDGLKQLITETDAGVRDAYDEAGNRLWRAAMPVPAAKQNRYDDDNRLLETPNDGATFGYDNNGNRLTRKDPVNGVVNYTFDGANRLSQVQSGGRTIDYIYDPDGRMLQRTVTTAGGATVQRFRYANRSIIATLDDQNDVQLLYTRDDEGRLLRRRSSAAVNPVPTIDPHSLFYLHDGLRSVCRLVDWDGTPRMDTSYTAWGQANTGGTITTDPFRYRGAFQDPDTGLLQFGARWYDPHLGRWLSQDPLLTSLAMTSTDLLPNFGELSNLYAYVRNTPLNFYDPDGLVASLPKGWPPPPGWKGGYKWKNQGNDKLTDPDGETWHWHPEDEGHHDHWDYGTGRGKKRLDRDGRDLGDDAFKDDEERETRGDEGTGEDTAKRVLTWGAVGVGAWLVAKWTIAALAAPETGGASLALAAVTP